MSEEAAAAAEVLTQETTTETTESSGGGEGTWFDSFSDDDKQFLSIKGWDKEDKGPADVLKSYRNLERMKGVDSEKTLTLPDPDDAEAVAAFKERIGVPDSPEKYQTPEIQVGDAALDGSVLAKLSHEAELSTAQHQKLTEGIGAYLNGLNEEQAEARAVRDTTEKNELESEWAGLKDENYQAATAAVKRFGVSADELNAMQGALGYRSTIELFTKIGRTFGEGRSAEVGGAGGGNAGSASFGVTPTVAKERLNALMKDANFHKALAEGDVDARQKWDDLKKIAFRVDN